MHVPILKNHEAQNIKKKRQNLGVISISSERRGEKKEGERCHGSLRVIILEEFREGGDFLRREWRGGPSATLLGGKKSKPLFRDPRDLFFQAGVRRGQHVNTHRKESEDERTVQIRPSPQRVEPSATK